MTIWEPCSNQNLVITSSVIKGLKCIVIMSPASKKLEGLIAFRLSIYQ